MLRSQGVRGEVFVDNDDGVSDEKDDDNSCC